jgi:hypothetical protein
MCSDQARQPARLTMLRLGMEALLGGLECEKGVRLGACVVRSMFVVSQAGGASDTRPESFLSSQPLRGTWPGTLIASHQTLLWSYLPCSQHHSFFLLPSSAHLSLSHLHPCHSSHHTAHPAHGYTRSHTVALASSNFGHSVTALRDYGFDQVLEVSVSAQSHLVIEHLCC